MCKLVTFWQQIKIFNNFYGSSSCMIMFHFPREIYGCKVDQWWLIMWLITKALFGCLFVLLVFLCQIFLRLPDFLNNTVYFLFIVQWPFESYWYLKYSLFTSVALRFCGKFLIWASLYYIFFLSFLLWNLIKFLFESWKVSNGFWCVNWGCRNFWNFSFCHLNCLALKKLKR